MARRGRVHVLRRRVSSSRVVPSESSRGASERARRRRVRHSMDELSNIRRQGDSRRVRRVRVRYSRVRASVRSRRKRRRVGWVSRRDAVFLAPRRRAESRINHRSRINVVSTKLDDETVRPGMRRHHHRRGGRAHHATDGGVLGRVRRRRVSERRVRARAFARGIRERRHVDDDVFGRRRGESSRGNVTARGERRSGHRGDHLCEHGVLDG